MMAKRKTKKEGVYTITTAYIDDKGYPRCSVCGELLTSGSIEYKEVIRNGECYVEFLKFCPNEKCKTKLKYYAQITMEGTTRYDFSDDEVIEVKESTDDINC